MSVTFTVREAVKDLIVANLVKPSLPSGDLLVYNAPDDLDPAGEGPVTLETFPTVVVQKGLYAEVDNWKRLTQAEVQYVWWLEIIVYLAQEELPSWEAQKLVEDWQTAMANVILAQPTLNGTVEEILTADNGDFMYSRDGFYDWFRQDTATPDSYWGIGFRMQVAQNYPFAENVGVSS